MTLGQFLRRVLGPFADSIIRFYREFYIDLESWATSLSRLSTARRILEIGCGDGHLTEALVRQFPDAYVVGTDIAESPGRLFTGRQDNVEFRRVTAEQLASEGETFELVVLTDVLHHVPAEERTRLIEDAWLLTSDKLAIKDWVKSRTPTSVAAYLSDRFMTGDRVRFFGSRDELHDLTMTTCVGGRICAEGSVPPRKNNVYLVIQKDGHV